jgi:hypothetical protein
MSSWKMPFEMSDEFRPFSEHIATRDFSRVAGESSDIPLPAALPARQVRYKPVSALNCGDEMPERVFPCREQLRQLGRHGRLPHVSGHLKGRGQFQMGQCGPLAKAEPQFATVFLVGEVGRPADPWLYMRAWARRRAGP